MNTREVIKNLKLLGGSLALFALAGITYSLSQILDKRKVVRRRDGQDVNLDHLVGTVRAVKNVEQENGDPETVLLDLKTKKEDILVYLGPAWYINHQKKKIKTGDKITVKGSRIQLEGQSLIIASQIIQDGMKLMLRDEHGMPYWDNWRKSYK